MQRVVDVTYARQLRLHQVKLHTIALRVSTVKTLLNVRLLTKPIGSLLEVKLCGVYGIQNEEQKCVNPLETLQPMSKS